MCVCVCVCVRARAHVADQLLYSKCTCANKVSQVKLFPEQAPGQCAHVDTTLRVRVHLVFDSQPGTAEKSGHCRRIVGNGLSIQYSRVRGESCLLPKVLCAQRHL